MDLEEFRAFLAVAETGSLLTAATRLRISRATLRRRVEHLEARAGTPLLDRSRSGATLTAAGRVLADRGRLLLQEASALVDSVRDTGTEPTGTARLMIPVGLPPHTLALLYGVLHTRLPRLAFDVHFSNDPSRELLVGVDMAFHFGQKSLDGPWTSREIIRIPIHLIAGEDYLRRRGTPRDVADLAAHDLLAWQAPGEDARLWPLADGGVFRVSPVVIAEDIHQLRQLALAGQGIALVPDVGLPDPGVPEGAVVQVLPALIGSETALRVIVPTALSHLPRVKALLALLEPLVGDLGGGPRRVRA